MVFLVGSSYEMGPALVKPTGSTSSILAQSLRQWVVTANAIQMNRVSRGHQDCRIHLWHYSATSRDSV